MKRGINTVKISDMELFDTSIRMIEPEKKTYLENESFPSGYEWWNKDWAISKDGSMIFKNYYRIDAERLDESDWILHFMTSKNWFDANTFLPAYFEACRRANIKKVTIQTHY